MAHTAYLGFGSNIGDRKRNILKAYERLSEKGLKIIEKSGFFKTAPYGYESQPEFLNSVALVEVEAGALRLLEIIKEVEKEIGRTETFRWGPRVIDIDILFFEDLVLKSEVLNIPHLDLHNRCFVLYPLAEIAPDFLHPVLKITVKELKKNCRGKVEKIEITPAPDLRF